MMHSFWDERAMWNSVCIEGPSPRTMCCMAKVVKARSSASKEAGDVTSYLGDSEQTSLLMGLSSWVRLSEQSLRAVKEETRRGVHVKILAQCLAQKYLVNGYSLWLLTLTRYYVCVFNKRYTHKHLFRSFHQQQWQKERQKWRSRCLLLQREANSFPCSVISVYCSSRAGS